MDFDPADEWQEWFRMAPLDRWSESMKLWAQYLAKEAALIPNPIHKVLSTFQNCKVRALLMGGQACVFYGAAEFSRDTDFAILADEANLQCLQADKAYWEPLKRELEQLRRTR